MDEIEVNFKSFITVTVASKILGVSKATIRKWESEGKVESLRHPINGYRLFKESELKKLLCKLKK